MDSILNSVKKMLGIQEEYEAFDQDIIMHINSVFMILNQIGVGPSKCFSISDSSSSWDEFKQGDDTLELKDGKYEVLGTDKITLNFKIINPKDNVDYDVKIIKNNTNNNYSGFVIDKESSDEIQTQTIFVWLE